MALSNPLCFVLLCSIITLTTASIYEEKKVADFDEELCTSGAAALVNDLTPGLSRGVLSVPGNVFFSPVALNFALGMAYAAASGSVAEQFETVMGYSRLGVSGQQVHESLHKLLYTTLSSNRSKDHEMTLANALFVRDETVVSPEFVDALQYFYHADFGHLDFNQSTSAMAEINEWARNRSSMMQEPFLSEPLPPNIRMVLTNAVHFKGTWKMQFPTGRTTRDYFYTGRRETKEVQMMSLFMETFNYYEDLDLKYKFVELPYKGDRMSMILSLPLQYDQPAELVLNSSSLCDLISRLAPTQLEMVALPRFEFHFERSFRRDLQELGLREAFDPASTGFFHDGRAGQVHLEDVLHRARIKVDESGSATASVTSDVDDFMPVAFREITEFVANHPFVFYVLDRETGVVVFIGRVDEPTGYPDDEDLKF